MEIKIPLWLMIPGLMLITLTYFSAFENYTTQEWLTGNGIIALGIGLVYLGEISYKKLKKKNGI